MAQIMTKGKKGEEMMEINQQELQEFWEWCGWINNGCYWFEPTEFGGNRYAPHGDKYNQVPPIDLNNLFKYAVPKLNAFTLAKQVGEAEYKASVLLKGESSGIVYNADPTQALYQAIQKARTK